MCAKHPAPVCCGASRALPSLLCHRRGLSLFFCNDPPTPEIYTLSLHDALPIYPPANRIGSQFAVDLRAAVHDASLSDSRVDRKSTRLNSSHLVISYAVFCL